MLLRVVDVRCSCPSMLKNSFLEHVVFLNQVLLFLLGEISVSGSISYYPKLRTSSGWSLIRLMRLYSSSVHEKVAIIRDIGLIIKMGLRFPKPPDPYIKGQ